MGKKKRQGRESQNHKEEKANRFTRRQLMKGLTAGAIALGITGPSQEALAQVGGKIRGTPEAARKFVEGMLEPNTRKQIESNPAAAIARFGIKVPQGMLPKTVKLPPVEEIRALLRTIDSGQGVIQVQAAFVIVFLAFFAFFAFFRK
jgi:hypothetical protein